ncbi:acetate--CoA ligase family protein [Micromonospora sp. DR5-3]|uniref:acetate--CoA ligase family protein n=1 Tax=unclassified Micromonospora TaxID=2617518 RepID=UPI0011D9E04B|nr:MULTISPECIES: acetate--CoA ligase family protein [unclassified Micromonospora]MCW3819072.1 acetate--CoA ligase family protein [Micromonospora sp. DR5-3]TYC20379.1 acetate--CoA ligase family protein [Micromonospora sp. MP36]
MKPASPPVPVRDAAEAGVPPDPELDLLFHPRTVAVIGASDTPGRPTTLNWRRVRDWAARTGATAVPVNPRRAEVDGTPTYPSVKEVPGDVDVAVVLVSDVDRVVQDAVDKGVRFLVVFAAGFAETGADGARRQADLVRRLAAGGVRMLGPNTNMNLFEAFRDDLPGRAIALITQSGHQGRPVFQGQELGIRFSHWAPTGNEGDLDAADFIDYFARLPETGAIAAYLEGFHDGPAFQRAAARAAQLGVPIVVVKVGRTAVGRSWAQSHTGHLAGADHVVSALLRQYGIARVDGLDELLDTAALFARAKRPPAPGVCVYSISGGTSAHMADLLTAAGIDLPELTPQTRERLREWIPDYLRIDNPVDNGGHPVGDWRGRKILDTILADPGVGILVVPITGAFPPMSDAFVADLVAVSATTDKPVCVVWGSPSGTEDAYRVGLLGSQLPVFRTFGNCVTAIRAFLDFHAFQDDLSELVPPEPRANPAPTATPGRTWTELESKELLTRYGIAVTRDVLCPDATAAAVAAASFDGPVVLKAVAAGIAHKSDLGLVRLGVRGPDEVASVVAEFERVVAAQAGASWQGVLVSEQLGGGVEMVVGIAPDPVFGPVVMAGIGGVAVEVYRDVAFRIPPFGRREAHRMLRELRGFPLLAGHRGAPPADLAALVDVIMAVQDIALDGVVTELDVNPLLALPDRAVALDALATGADRG